MSITEWGEPMKELVEFMAKNLVNDPSQVRVKQIDRPHRA